MTRRDAMRLGAGAALCTELALTRAFAQGETAAPSTPKAARVRSSVMVWTLKGSFEEKIQAVAETGIQSIELVSEHESWSEENVKQYRSLLRSYRLSIDLLLGSQRWTTRPVTMVNPAHREGFLADVRSAIDWAHRLEVPQIILMSGNDQPSLSHAQQYASLVEGGKRAADLAAAAGDITLVLENLNSKVDHKGYFLVSARESMKAVTEVDNPHFRMLFDLYHEAVQTGASPQALAVEAEPLVNVYHVADAPGRHDPGTGTLPWDGIYQAIGATNYAGYIALEYRPQGEQVASLKKAVTQMRAGLNRGSKAEGAAKASPSN